MPDLLRQLGHAARSLRRSPVFTLSAVLTLAVCIGANVAIFSLVDTLLLRPLPYPDPGRLVSIEKGGAKGRDDLRVDVAPWIQEMRAFSSAGLFTTGTLNVSGGAEPAHVKAAMVSPGFFTVLGVRPALGRTLVAEDHVKRGAYAVVLSDGLWRRMFARDPAVAGRTVEINGRPALALAGVMRSFLVNVVPTDPLVLASTSLALLAVAVAGSFAPALRAASVDPAITLRTE